MADTRITSDHSAVKTEPVIIGPGKYRTKRGDIVEILSTDGFLWFDQPRYKGGNAWNSDGSPHRTFEGLLAAIVERVGEPAAEAAKAAFSITGPGLYRMRNGREVPVVYSAEEVYKGQHWLFVDSDGYRFSWGDNGEFNTSGLQKESTHDLVAGPFPQYVSSRAAEVDSAGLKGFAGVQDSRLIHFATADNAFAHGWVQVIDLSTIRTDQLVQPEPKPEPRKVKGWINVQWDHKSPGETIVNGPYASRQEADELHEDDEDGPRIACIEVEFVEGEGL